MSWTCSPSLRPIRSLDVFDAEKYLVLMSFSRLIGQVKIHCFPKQFAHVAALRLGERGQIFVRLRTKLCSNVLKFFGHYEFLASAEITRRMSRVIFSMNFGRISHNTFESVTSAWSKAVMRGSASVARTDLGVNWKNLKWTILGWSQLAPPLQRATVITVRTPSRCWTQVICGDRAIEARPPPWAPGYDRSQDHSLTRAQARPVNQSPQGSFPSCVGPKCVLTKVT